MKQRAWDDLLSIGIEEVDNDHRILLNLFNLLAEAASEEEDDEYLAVVLEELINATAWHFSHEERLMLECSYPNLAAHKTEHQDLMDSVRAFQDSWLKDGTLEADEFEFLERWLTEHILVSDMKFGSWIASS